MLTRQRKALIGIVFLALALLTTTYASNITINAGNGVQYGQGLYQIKACNQWMNVLLNEGTINGTDPTLYVTSMLITGLDAVHCSNTTFSVQLWNGNSQLNIYNGKFAPQNSVVLGIGNATTQVDHTCLIDNGTAVGTHDNYINYAYQSNNGGYQVNFVSPLAASTNVTTIVVQSAQDNNTGC